MLIMSISGIRGTIGGMVGENLTAIDVVRYASAYGAWVLKKNSRSQIIIGRDGRNSGEIITSLVIQTLRSIGVSVVNLDYATTPTVGMMVVQHKSQGGLVITASHNSIEYNGIKMLNENGEFLSEKDTQEIMNILEQGDISFAKHNVLGSLTRYYNHTQEHVDSILALDLVDTENIKSKKYTIAIDAINSVGGIAVPLLLEKLGINIIGLHTDNSGNFAHNPEPLEKNLRELKSLVTKTHSQLGIAVDPDVDRLVFVDEHGDMVNEEYTIVAIADYVLSKTPGNTVSNLSSSRALMDVTRSYGQKHYTSAVGEKNVVEKMKEKNAVIGGEGSGGVIYPPLHYGRDALVGIALFLSHLSQQNSSVSTLRKKYPDYCIAKEKIVLTEGINIDCIFSRLAYTYRSEKVSLVDGIKIDFPESWIHLRKSNTEPIIRLYAEAKTEHQAHALAVRFIAEITNKISNS